jgi:hypothetical protein
LAFYKNNPLHTKDTKARSAAYIAVYEDVLVYKDFSFTPGLEFFYYGLSYNSYFFDQGGQPLYDKRFNYHYTLTLQDIRLNILCRQVLGLETRNVITGYFQYGFVMNYLFSAKLKVNSNLTGTEVFNGKPDVAYEHGLLSKKITPALKIVGGVQHNFFRSHRAWFFEGSYVYNISRFGIRNSFAPSSLYIRNSFFELGLGVKF